MQIELPHNWEQREYQKPLWRYLEGGGTRAVEVAHRRWGKDDVALHWTATAAMKRPATYWHMLPEYSQARKAIWAAINPHTGIRRIDEAFPKEIRANTNEQEMFIRFKNGATWQVVGSDSYNNTVGSPPAGIVLSEWSIAKPEAWGYLKPILRENGGWAIFIYTPRGENHGLSMLEYAQTKDNWFAEVSKVDDTQALTEDELKEELDEYISLYGKSRGLAMYKQEYFCSFDEAFDGKVVYPDFNRKTHVASEPLLPFVQEGTKKGAQIIRGWDNTGLHPACVLTYINSIGQWYIFKEFWGNDITCVDFAESVLMWCNQHFPETLDRVKDAWVPFKNYRDIADPAGGYRDSMKKSPAQYVFEECGLRLENGIQTFKIRVESVTKQLNKLVQGEPVVVVDPSCKLTIKGFEGGYSYPEIGQTGQYKTEIKGDAKDQYADIHDAIQYIATRIFGAYEEEDFRDTYDGRQGRNPAGGY
jgi:hypothetical protein